VPGAKPVPDPVNLFEAEATKIKGIVPALDTV